MSLQGNEGVNTRAISFYNYLIQRFKTIELRMIMVILKRKYYVSKYSRFGTTKKNIASHIISEYFYTFLFINMMRERRIFISNEDRNKYYFYFRFWKYSSSSNCEISEESVNNYIAGLTGIPTIISDDNRGNLIIHFLLTKDENFDEKLLRFFS